MADLPRGALTYNRLYESQCLKEIQPIHSGVLDNIDTPILDVAVIYEKQLNGILTTACMVGVWDGKLSERRCSRQH